MGLAQAPHLPRLRCTVLVALLPILAKMAGSFMLGSAEMDLLKDMGGARPDLCKELVLLRTELEADEVGDMVMGVRRLLEVAMELLEPLIILLRDDEVAWREMDLWGGARAPGVTAGFLGVLSMVLVELLFWVWTEDMLLVLEYRLILSCGEGDRFLLVTCGLGANLMAALAILCGLRLAEELAVDATLASSMALTGLGKSGTTSGSASLSWSKAKALLGTTGLATGE